MCEAALSVEGAVGAATLRGAAGGYAARDVVASEDDLEVVGHEGAHVAVGVADLVLRLVRLHYGEVGIGAFGGCGGRTVLLPPSRRKLRLLLEGGADGLLLGSVGIMMTVTVGTVGFTRLFVDTVNHALFRA